MDQALYTVPHQYHIILCHTQNILQRENVDQNGPGVSLLWFHTGFHTIQHLHSRLPHARFLTPHCSHTPALLNSFAFLFLQRQLDYISEHARTWKLKVTSNKKKQSIFRDVDRNWETKSCSQVASWIGEQSI